GTSTVILSVSSSTSVSPGATASPSLFSHLETVASTMDSPSGGTLIDVISQAYTFHLCESTHDLGARRTRATSGARRPFDARRSFSRRYSRARSRRGAEPSRSLRDHWAARNDAHASVDRWERCVRRRG